MIGLVAIGLALLPRNSRLAYQGRSLESWMRDYGSRPIGGGLIHDKFSVGRRQLPKGSPSEAIRAMGTNVIVPLLAEIKRPDGPPWAEASKRFLTKLPWPKLQFQDTQSRREQAAMAFFDLGTTGIAAIPELTRLLTNYSSSVFAAHALAGMGTNAIPAFTTALASSNTWIMDCGAWGLAQIGAESRVIVPQILLQLPKGNTADQMLMVWALGEIRAPAELILPELTSRLRHSDPQVRNSAAQALCRFGPEAKAAAAEIKAALNNESDSDARAALEKLLPLINSEVEVTSPTGN
jgi:HEAT repeat protein